VRRHTQKNQEQPTHNLYEDDQGLDEKEDEKSVVRDLEAKGTRHMDLLEHLMEHPRTTPTAASKLKVLLHEDKLPANSVLSHGADGVTNKDKGAAGRKRRPHASHTMVGGDMNKLNHGRTLLIELKDVYLDGDENVIDWRPRLNKFFNGHESSGKKASWVQWKKALAPKETWSSIFSLDSHNRGFDILNGVLEILPICLRFGLVYHGYKWTNGKIDENLGKELNSCWINIIKKLRRLERKGINLLLFMKKKLGNGLSTLFWDDVCDGAKLRLEFPSSVCARKQQQITVGVQNLCAS
ncbi:hypothetical protein Tco_1199399, partial [Tanacetum coccineum]